MVGRTRASLSPMEAKLGPIPARYPQCRTLGGERSGSFLRKSGLANVERLFCKRVTRPEVGKLNLRRIAHAV
jgi:hypothetical protein